MKMTDGFYSQSVQPKNARFNAAMPGNIWLIVCILLCAAAFVSPARAAQSPATIRFNGGSCQISALNTRPPFAPADMKEGEKAFMLQFKYTLNKGVTTDALDVLYEKGLFKAPDGKTYKAGAAAVREDDSIYSLIVAVPENIDVETLKFTYDKSATESLKVEIERVSAK
jgi:hypothetical protein